MSPRDFLTEGGKADFDAFSLEYFVLSERGPDNERNQDSYRVFLDSELVRTDGRGVIFAIADGVGGNVFSHRASIMTLDILSTFFKKTFTTGVASELELTIREANWEVYLKAQKNPLFKGIGSTIACVLLYKDNAYTFGVGDSIVYKYSSDNQEMISCNKSHRHPITKELTEAIGKGNQLNICRAEYPLIQNGEVIDGYYILCTDGVSSFVSLTRIREITKEIDNVEQIAMTLRNTARQFGSKDDITVMVIGVYWTPNTTQ